MAHRPAGDLQVSTRLDPGFAPSDGVPHTASRDGREPPPAPPSRNRPGFDDSRLAQRVRRVEGPRGRANRVAVWVRYAAYGLIVLAASAVAHAMFAGSSWTSGGYVMLYSATSMFATAAVGTWFYVNHRQEILEQCRHYVFGIAVWPGLFFAILYRVTRPMFASPLAQSDAFLSVLGNAIPILYFTTVLIPAAIFVKVVAGLRNLHRSSTDDQEMLRDVARQDGRQL